jgi:hypothetical protein
LWGSHDPTSKVLFQHRLASFSLLFNRSNIKVVATTGRRVELDLRLDEQDEMRPKKTQDAIERDAPKSITRSLPKMTRPEVPGVFQHRQDGENNDDHESYQYWLSIEWELG